MTVDVKTPQQEAAGNGPTDATVVSSSVAGGLLALVSLILVWPTNFSRVELLLPLVSPLIFIYIPLSVVSAVLVARHTRGADSWIGAAVAAVTPEIALLGVYYLLLGSTQESLANQVGVSAEDVDFSLSPSVVAPAVAGVLSAVALGVMYLYRRLTQKR